MRRAFAQTCVPPEESMRRMYAPLTALMSHPVVCVGPEDSAEDVLRWIAGPEGLAFVK